MNTILYPLLGTLFTFLMTTLGSALVFFFKDEIKDFYQQLFLGFAAGIMIAASVWSLLIPFRWRIYHWSLILAFFRSCDSSSTLK